MWRLKHGVRKFTVQCFGSRRYHVLAIETSCDDTSVAWLDHDPVLEQTRVLDNVKSTLDSVAQGGIVPTEAHLHHQLQLGLLVEQVYKNQGKLPDVICATRGPGMVGSLSVGLNVAKGLSIGWGRPLLGINHMLGHLLVPRLFDKSIKFPFISLLVSGGHCILVRSTSVLNHKILCESIDIAVGDSLDKCGREIGLKGIMIGKDLDHYTRGIDPNNSDPIVNQIKLPNPLTKSSKHKIGFSFAPFITSVKEFLKLHPLDSLSQEQHILLAAKIQDAIFNHIITKIKHVIEKQPEMFENVNHFVCSGGVSANLQLREKLVEQIKPNFKSFHYPQLEFCTDNAVMIGSAGIELYDLYQQNIYNSLNILPLRKWSLEEIESISKFSTCK